MRFQLVLMLLLLTSAHQRRFQTSATPQQRQKLYGDDNADDDDAGAADVPMSEFLRRMTALRRNTTDLGEGQVAVAIRVAELLRAASDAKISHAALAELREAGAEVIRASAQPKPPAPPRLHTEYTRLSGRELHRAPAVHLFDDFFSAEEAEHIVSLARPRLQASTARDVHGTDAGTRIDKVIAGRTSQTAGVDPWEDPIVANLTARVAGIVGLGVENLEVLSVTRYTGQQQYKAHVDSFGLRNRQDRFVTALLYLNDIPLGMGGGTRFPRLRDRSGNKPLDVSPAQGRMLIFHNLKQTLETEPLTVHAGLPMHGAEAENLGVEDSTQEKWIANCWFHGEKWEEPPNYWPAHWLAALPCSPQCNDEEIPKWAGNDTAHLRAKAHQDRVQWKHLWKPTRAASALPSVSPPRVGAATHGSLTMTSSEL